VLAGAAQLQASDNFQLLATHMKITHTVVTWKKVLLVLARGKMNKVHGPQLLFLYIWFESCVVNFNTAVDVC
jgi:hypothetical protein